MAEEKKVVTKKTTAKTASSEPVTPKRPVEVKEAPAGAQKKTSVKKAPTPETAPAPAPAPEPAPDALTAPAPKAAAKAATPPGGGSSAGKPTAGPAHQAPSVEDRAVSLTPLGEVSAEQRWRMIADAAYYRAEKRNFAAGYQEGDWLAAEAEVDALLRGHAAAAPDGLAQGPEAQATVGADVA